MSCFLKTLVKTLIKRTWHFSFSRATCQSRGIVYHAPCLNCKTTWPFVLSITWDQTAKLPFDIWGTHMLSVQFGANKVARNCRPLARSFIFIDITVFRTASKKSTNSVQFISRLTCDVFICMFCGYVSYLISLHHVDNSCRQVNALSLSFGDITTTGDSKRSS